MLAPPRGNAGSSALKTDDFCVEADGLCFFSGRTFSEAASFLRFIGAIVLLTFANQFLIPHIVRRRFEPLAV